ncbi:hypothetical protein [Streptomyces xantholiticus]|nr:hypothetical protein [Streptomyces xantholiticus]GGW71705.1 hypothetical protein GCM10010381_65440 [Streptomyces xantholiticus]
MRADGTWNAVGASTVRPARALTVMEQEIATLVQELPGILDG